MSVLRRLKFDDGNIAEIGYDVRTSTMEIVFRDVPEYLYTYKDVPSKTFCELLNAESVGSHFAKTIRPHPSVFPFTKSLTGRGHTRQVDTKIKK